MISQLGGLPEEFWETYNIAINLGIGEEVESLKRLNISYEGAVSALRCGLHDKPGEAVYYNEIKNLENTKIYYNGGKRNAAHTQYQNRRGKRFCRRFLTKFTVLIFMSAICRTVH